MTRVVTTASLALSVAILASSAPPAAAATLSVLYSFKNAGYGHPTGRLFFHDGSLFGTGEGTGIAPKGCGQVFELTQSGSSWKASSRLKFNGADGCTPFDGLISDSHGVLYGTAGNGDAFGGGNVFGLQKTGVGWVHGTIWAFGNGDDGESPDCDLIMDSSGNLYGTTSAGGTAFDGTVFELSVSGGVWTETVLHNFSGSDGYAPAAGLLMDKTGTLYGTTAAGGVMTECAGYGCGTVFALTPGGGGWTFSSLHTFHGGTDGAEPLAALVEGSNGVLYGTTSNGNFRGSGYGNVFKLSQSGGVWKEKVLYNFTGGTDGGTPNAALHWNGAGGLYGTTEFGGTFNNGTVYQLTESGGAWSEIVLHSFGTSGSDGKNPNGAVILDKSGNLYGTTLFGGTYGNGTVWEAVP